MGSLGKALNPEAKPWQPSTCTRRYYPISGGYVKARTEVVGAAVSLYNVGDQPNGWVAGKIPTPTGNGERKEVVYRRRRCGCGCGVKEKALKNRPFRCQRKSKSAEKMSDCDGGDERTTVMIKNIPNQFRRDTLISFLDEYCIKFELEYDFVYLPMDFESLDNLGYAFVNFTSSYAATKIQQVLTNYKWGLIRVENGCAQSNKICQVTWARLQGKEELVKNFVNSNFICYTDDYLPVVLDPASNGSNLSSITLSPIGKCRGLPLLAPKIANTLSC